MFERFYDKYESEEHVVIALMGRSLGVSRDFRAQCYTPSAMILAALFCDSGKLITRRMHLSWPVDGIDLDTQKGIKRFTPEQVCRLKIRKLKDKFADESNIPQFCLSRVVRSHVECPEIDSLLEEYHQQIVLQDDVLGTLKLVRDLQLFNATVKWCGRDVLLNLYVEVFEKDSWTQAISNAKTMLGECNSWESKMQKYVAHELIDSANERILGDYGRGSISEKDFADRLTLVKLVLSLDGTFKAYFDCDIFYYRHLTVTGSMQGGFEGADVEES